MFEGIQVNQHCELTAQMQDKLLKMLVRLRNLFEKNDIPFFLACGTALGCVRHKGYIPWDDDVDIYIYGRDLKKIRRVFAEQDTGNLVLQDGEITKGYPYSFPKVVAKDTILVEQGLEYLDYRGGVYIDLFPLVEVSSNALVRRFQESRRYADYALLRAYYLKFNSPLRNALGTVVRRLFRPEKIQKALYQQYVRHLSPQAYLIDGGTFGNQAILQPSYFDAVCHMPFAGEMMPMPKAYDAYLTHYYGDYMQLPPEEQRVSNHDFAQIVMEQTEG